jgi:hypothetical protein
MFKRPYIKASVFFAAAAAIAYCIPIYFYIRRSDYTASWMLYLGNFLFMAVIGVFLFYYSGLNIPKGSTLSLVATGQKEVFLAMGFAVFLSFVLLIILVPRLFGTGVPGKIMANKPANTIQTRTNGLEFTVMTNSIIGNFVTGAFISVLLPPSLNIRRSGKKKSGKIEQGK